MRTKLAVWRGAFTKSSVVMIWTGASADPMAISAYRPSAR